MTPRERFADWISGGKLTYWGELYGAEVGRHLRTRTEAANIAAQRDVAIFRAEVVEKQKREAALDALAAYGQAGDACTALRAILTARNITEARKIARNALGEE